MLESKSTSAPQLSMEPWKLKLDEEKSKHDAGLTNQNHFSPAAFLHSLLRLVKGTSQSQTNSSTGVDFVLMILDEEKPWQNGFVPGIFLHRVLSLAKGTQHSRTPHLLLIG
jgi:hypothetical protein